MPVITFTEDVTLESEAPETGPHYRKGYCVDAAAKVAQEWVSKGVAVYGKIEIAAPVIEPAVIEEPAEEEKPKPSRRRKRWTPDD